MRFFNIMFDISKISKLPIWLRYLLIFTLALLCFHFIFIFISSILTENITNAIIFGVISILFILFWVFNFYQILKLRNK